MLDVYNSKCTALYFDSSPAISFLQSKIGIKQSKTVRRPPPIDECSDICINIRLRPQAEMILIFTCYSVKKREKARQNKASSHKNIHKSTVPKFLKPIQNFKDQFRWYLKFDKLICSKLEIQNFQQGSHFIRNKHL